MPSSSFYDNADTSITAVTDIANQAAASASAAGSSATASASSATASAGSATAASSSATAAATSASSAAVSAAAAASAAEDALAQMHIFNVDDYGSFHDFFNDDTPAIQAAINAAVAAGGGSVTLGPHAYWVNSDDITVPSGVTLKAVGNFQRYMVGTDNTSLPSSLYFANPHGLIVLGGKVEGVAVFNDIVHFLTPGSTRASCRAFVSAFSGTGIKVGTGGLPILSNYSVIEDVYIGGFNLGILQDRASNVTYRNVLGDCTNGMKIDRSYDDNYIASMGWIGSLTSGQAHAADNWPIISVADNGFGLYRLTLGTNDIVDGEDLMVTPGTGAEGMWGLWPGVTKVDATHVDLPGSSFAPTTTGDTGNGQLWIPLASTNNLQPGMAVSGTNIPAGATIGAVSRALGGVFLDQNHPATGTASGVTLTFTSNAYTPSSSTLRYDGTARPGVGFDFARADGTRGDGLFPYGYRTGFQFSGSIGMSLVNVQVDAFSFQVSNHNSQIVGLHFTGTQTYDNRIEGSLITGRGTSVLSDATNSPGSYANTVSGFRPAVAQNVLELVSGSLIMSEFQDQLSHAICIDSAAEDAIFSSNQLAGTSIYPTVLTSPGWTDQNRFGGVSWAKTPRTIAANVINLGGRTGSLLQLADLSQAADGKYTNIQVGSGEFYMHLLTDVGAVGSTPVTVRRDGAVAREFLLGCPLILKTYTVVGLPSIVATYMECWVSDANAPVVGSTVVGGGSSKARVAWNGAAWKVTAVI